MAQSPRGLCHLTLPSSGRAKGRFAPLAPPLMSHVRSLVQARNGGPTSSLHGGAVLHEPHLARSSFSVPAVECQSVEGAPRRRAAPGNQSVKVAAGAATSGRRRSARTAQPSLAPSQAAPSQLKAEHTPVPAQRSGYQFRPCAEAQRLRSSRATTGVGASAHARHALATHCPAITGPTLGASEHNRRVRSKSSAFLRQAPNPSIERTSQRPLRALWPAAHVKR